VHVAFTFVVFRGYVHTIQLDCTYVLPGIYGDVEQIARSLAHGLEQLFYGGEGVVD